jgi:hypothetical protein
MMFRVMFGMPWMMAFYHSLDVQGAEIGSQNPVGSVPDLMKGAAVMARTPVGIAGTDSNAHRALYGFYQIEETEFCGVKGEHHAPLRPANGRKEAGLSQIVLYAARKGIGDILPRSSLPYRKRPAFLLKQRGYQAYRVIRSPRYLHNALL